MPALTLPYTLTPGDPENVNHVQQNFDAITTWANTTGAAEENLTSGFLDKIGVSTIGTVRRAFQGETNTESTVSQTWVDLGGPTISVSVPTNALVHIYAQADILSGNIAIYEPTDYATPIQVMTNGTATFATVRTGGTGSGGVLPSANIGNPFAFPATAGTRTFSMRYASNLFGGTAQFKNRKLWVRIEGY